MAITDLFSKRQKRLRGEIPDVYRYTVIPDALRVQVVHIMNDAIGPPMFQNFASTSNDAAQAYIAIYDILCREYGQFELAKGRDRQKALWNFFGHRETTTEQALDVIETCFRHIDIVVREHPGLYRGRCQSSDQAIEELNTRFREHGVGYQYEAGMIVRVDSKLIHAEVVKPALALLSAKGFKGPNEEFLSAHQHFRKKEYSACLNECLKAFESTMKVICDKRRWPYDPQKSTAKDLIQILFDNGLVPSFMQSHFTGLRTTLEAGLPTIRNRRSGHGQGAATQEIPESIASYALHLTATNIVFLVQAEQELP